MQFSSSPVMIGDVIGIVFYGENHIIEHPSLATVHAECDAINKLIKSPLKYKKLDLLVIRQTQNGVIGESRPCNNCLKKIKFIVQHKGIKIKYILYSTKDGTIVKEKLTDMLESDIVHTSKGYLWKHNS